ncbi:MAG: FtsW/RodA/SpoVE family cell cycle protein, partial [Gammaproteobacteria bacterium]|nr:FtsW/RodA/SpoVE family cell cycle protein [Gammaproteobacteria bacterium]
MSLGSLETGSRRELVFSPLYWRNIVMDVPLLVTLLAVNGLGLVVLYSAVGSNATLLLRQGVRFLIALTAFLFVAQIPPRILRLWTPRIFFFGLVLLVLVILIGDVGQGAQRWLDLGIFSFQPSELLKLAVPMMSAWFMHERRLPPTFTELLVLILIIVIPALLIARQPDLG